jgi:hypothetical protein
VKREPFILTRLNRWGSEEHYILSIFTTLFISIHVEIDTIFYYYFFLIKKTDSISGLPFCSYVVDFSVCLFF